MVAESPILHAAGWVDHEGKSRRRDEWQGAMAGAASRCAGSGTLPVIGLQTQVPEPERLAWYAGLGLMAAFELVANVTSDLGACIAAGGTIRMMRSPPPSPKGDRAAAPPDPGSASEGVEGPDSSARALRRRARGLERLDIGGAARLAGGGPEIVEGLDHVAPPVGRDGGDEPGDLPAAGPGDGVDDAPTLASA